VAETYRPAMSVTGGRTVGGVIQPYRVKVEVEILPSTLALMQAVLDHPEEFAFVDEFTFGGTVDAIVEGFFELLDVELRLVRGQRREAIRAGAR
jgi:hypothetical protein